MYTLAIAKTDLEKALFDMYCAGHSYFWNLFFGWRRTRKVEDEEWCYYRVPTQIPVLVQAHIMYLKKRGVLNESGKV